MEQRPANIFNSVVFPAPDAPIKLHGPTDFGCTVKLRSEAKRATIMRELAAAQEIFSKSD